jgi:signal peptidase II
MAVIGLDQLTKWWALHALDDRSINLVWTLRLHLVHNTGAAFSLGEGLGPLMAGLVVVVMVLLARHAARTDDPIVHVTVGAIVGGALANLIDRVFRADDGLLSGAVVDFVDLQWWPVFNVADAVIVVGGILMVLRGWIRG